MFNPRRVSEYTGEWENQTAPRHWRGGLGKASALSADPALPDLPSSEPPCKDGDSCSSQASLLALGPELSKFKQPVDHMFREWAPGLAFY